VQSNQFAAGLVETSRRVVDRKAFPQIRTRDVTTELGGLFDARFIPRDFATEEVRLADELTASGLEAPGLAVWFVAGWKFRPAFLLRRNA
jgi:hypothetical protein